MPPIHGSSTSREIGSRSAVSARSMTFGDSAMNRPFAGFKLVAKLDFREIRVCRHALVVNGIKMDELHVIDLSPNSCQIQENPLFPRGLLVSGAGLEPARLYK